MYIAYRMKSSTHTLFVPRNTMGNGTLWGGLPADFLVSEAGDEVNQTGYIHTRASGGDAVLGYLVPYYPPAGGTPSTWEYFAGQSACIRLPGFVANQRCQADSLASKPCTMDPLKLPLTKLANNRCQSSKLDKNTDLQFQVPF